MATTEKNKTERTKQESALNEGFSGDNLPRDYNPSAGMKQDTEIEKDENGDTEVVKRSRDVEENNAKDVDSTSGTAKDTGKSKSRGTTSEAENIKTAQNRDFNSAVDGKQQIKQQKPSK